MQWYGDNSELKGIWNAPIPDILLFGGIALGKEQAESLRRLIIDFKHEYRKEADFPIKWNLKDLQRWFKNKNHQELHQKLLKESKDWRTSLIRASLAIDYKIIAACVVCHSSKIEKIKEHKPNIIKYTFCNALMRVALYAKGINASNFEIILDWPEGNTHTPYSEEYRSAYYNGCCHASPEIKYYSGPLKAIGFNEALYFARMEDCSLLQFSDIVLGTTREFVDFCLGKRNHDHLGVELTKYLIPKYRGFPSRIIGRGISIAPTDSTLSKRLFDGVVEIRKRLNI
jgi:hypothetical protein